MVVLASSIINKSGKALVSRQFVDMTRIRIEGLLAAFPKLVGSGKQHTYVETENVRYVYQPMESLYLILVTNKQSNILEDLETLRLLSKLIPEYCTSLEEESVCKNGFKLIFAFDEVICQGHKEAVSASQVKEYMEMDSQEERMHRMMMQTKINETKDLMKKKANEIDKSKLDKTRPDRSGIISVPISFDNGYDLPSTGRSNGTFVADESKSKGRPTTAAAGSSKKGMQLGKGQKTSRIIECLKAEGEDIVEDVQAAAVVGLTASVPTDPIAVLVEEKITVQCKRDGGLESFDIQGTLSLVVQNRDDAFIRVQVENGANDGVQFKPHPNIDKDLFARESILGLKDSRRPFPTGTPTGILKWRMTSKDESLIPLNINCWPSISGGETYVSIEYEASQRFELQNVKITIPLPALRDPPTVNQVDGEWRYDSRRSVLEWSVVLIDNSNRNGAMEFVVPAADASVFFPIDVKFTATKTFCDLKVVSVLQVDGGNSVRFAGSTQLLADSYQVV
ncbi:hypothetical protein SELMODRAFT_172790 [Selaginella moellendorffii]|uniref:Coatomer subunit delta n=1 Tax=Selaginella moellendorffii TaxID=88036 RepID=D8RMS6_SELML|nr:coatomer subunit delta-2 [Selaginella moellendorffii]EFJ26392.1 hypothetical protein SELMODRAFT_172790 [Selaginella moellendorffii]|eukprot:XP_002972306.1 coatomer subunit delta-2 [Selaginella moellendorffii]